MARCVLELTRKISIEPIEVSPDQTPITRTIAPLQLSVTVCLHVLLLFPYIPSSFSLMQTRRKNWLSRWLPSLEWMPETKECRDAHEGKEEMERCDCEGCGEFSTGSSFNERLRVPADIRSFRFWLKLSTFLRGKLYLPFNGRVCHNDRVRNYVNTCAVCFSIVNIL